jgi:hypothetical protein
MRTTYKCKMIIKGLVKKTATFDRTAKTRDLVLLKRKVII